MNIAPITTSAIPRTGFAAIAGVEAIAAPLDPLALPAAAGADLDAAIVALSNPGRLLSAAAAFQAQQTGAGFGDLVGAAQLFIDALNQLQTGSTDLVQNPLGTPFGNVLLLALDAAPQSGSGESLRAVLAQVGITFQETSIFGDAGQFDIDLTALQNAFETDPAGTTSLLEQAFQTLAQFATRLAAQNLDLFATEAGSAPTGNTASLFDVDLLTAPFTALNPVDAATVDAALQRLPADLVLTDAVAATAAPAQTGATPAGAESAAGVTQAGSDSAVPETGTNTITAALSADNAVAASSSGVDVAPGVAASIAPTAPAGVAISTEAGAIATGAAAQTDAATPTTATTATSNLADPGAADAALRRLQAEQAVRNTSVTNPAPATTAAPVNAETAAASTLDVLDNRVNAITTAASAVANAGLPEASLAAPGVTAPGVSIAGVPVAGIVAEALAPAAIFQDFSAPGAGTVANATPVTTQSTVPPQDVNNLRFRTIDPSVAAAVAAYRVGDGFFGTPASVMARASPEVIADIVAVTRVRPVTLDLHDGATETWRNRAARHVVNPVELRNALAAAHALPAGYEGVNLAA